MLFYLVPVVLTKGLYVLVVFTSLMSLLRTKKRKEMGRRFQCTAMLIMYCLLTDQRQPSDQRQKRCKQLLMIL
jgi:hypothetical protein